MMFDWIQKSAIFGYQMRLAPVTTAGRATRAYDVLERSNNGESMYYPNVILVREGVTNYITRTTLTMRVYWIIETKYRESQTVAIPPFIRTGAKYKSLLYQKFSALFEEFKTPELFGTFTRDDRSDGQVGVAEHFGGPGAKQNTQRSCSIYYALEETVESFLELGCEKKKGPAGVGGKTSRRCSSVVLGIRIAGSRNATYSLLYLDRE